MDLLLETLLDRPHHAEHSTRPARRRLLGVLVAVRAITTLRHLSERSRCLRSDLTGELFLKTGRLFYNTCDCELQRKALRMGWEVVPLTTLQAVRVTNEARLEFSLFTTEGQEFQFRVTSLSEKDKWMKAITAAGQGHVR